VQFATKLKLLSENTWSHSAACCQRLLHCSRSVCQDCRSSFPVDNICVLAACDEQHPGSTSQCACRKRVHRTVADAWLVCRSLDRYDISVQIYTATQLEVKDNSHAIQWRRQDLLRGGAKLESRLWGTHGGLQGRVQQLIDD